MTEPRTNGDSEEPPLKPLGMIEENFMLHLALEHTADSVLISTRDGNVLYANRSLARITGYELDELIGQPVAILRAGRMPASFYEEMARVLNSGGVFRGTFIS